MSLAHALIAAVTTSVLVPAAVSVPALATTTASETARACAPGFDVAVAAPYDTVGGQYRAGTVTLFDGMKNARVLAQGDSLIGDEPERNDSFGSAVVTGDFNGDGCRDLAIGASEEFVGTPVPDGADGNGIVHLLYGTAHGLRAGGTIDVRRLGRSHDTDRFGAALAVGDLDKDGDDELIVGIPGLSEGGGVGVFGYKGIRPSGKGLLITQATRWVGQDVGEGDQFGVAVAAGDFDGDGRAELAVGAPSDDVGDRLGAGSVTILDLRARQAGLYTQNSPGVGGDAEKWDNFGATVASGDFNGDGRDDLAIGVPGEGLDALQDGPMYGDGAVHALYGTKRGLSAVGSEFWTQKSRGIVGKNRNTDRFGSALATGDLNGDGDGELAVGVPGENAVQVLAGSHAGGLTYLHNKLITGRAGHPGDLYGSAVAIIPAGLLVGAPGAARLTLIPSTVHNGTYTGLRPASPRLFNGGPLFGYALTP